MTTMKFRLAAKTDMGVVRTNNEDNFQVAADLTSDKMQWINNEVYSLGEKGTLLLNWPLRQYVNISRLKD